MAQHVAPTTWKTKLTNMPIFGPIFRIGSSVIHLPQRLDELAHSQQVLTQTLKRNEAKLDETNTAHQELQAQAAELTDDAASLNNRLIVLGERVADLAHSAVETIAKNPSEINNTTTSEVRLFTDDRGLDDFYVAFEDHFRGTEEEIKQRLQVYIPYFRSLGINFDEKPVLDIGCGRGEMLSVLRDENITAYGIDINARMVSHCIALGLRAIQTDVLPYLKQQKTGSLGVITGFHIVEHIPFDFLLHLFAECARVLTPGGIVIFETPNPENIHVGAFSFYFDPSHLNPLAPDVLAFAVQNRGFDKTEILRLHPKDKAAIDAHTKDSHLHEMVRRFYMEQDYAVIGYKAALRVQKKKRLTRG